MEELKLNEEVIFKKRNLYGPFLLMKFNCLKARATSRGPFTFTTKFPETVTHFIGLGRMKHLVNRGAT